VKSHRPSRWRDLVAALTELLHHFAELLAWIQKIKPLWIPRRLSKLQMFVISLSIVYAITFALFGSLHVDHFICGLTAAFFALILLMVAFGCFPDPEHVRKRPLTQRRLRRGQNP